MRTGTKIEIGAVIWVAAVLSFWTIFLPLLCIDHPELLVFRENIKEVVHSLTGGGGVVVLIVELRKTLENTDGLASIKEKFKGFTSRKKEKEEGREQE